MRKRNTTISVAIAALFATLGLMLAYIEVLIPLPMPFPGMKLGLANLVTLLALYTLGVRYAPVIAFLRILLSALLFGSPTGFLFSLAGGMLAYLAMLSAKAMRIHVIATSVLGALLHQVGQVTVAIFMTSTPRVLYYLAPLSVAAVITGTIIGIAAMCCLRLLRKTSLSVFSG